MEMIQLSFIFSPLKLVFLSKSSRYTCPRTLPGFLLHQLSCPLEAQMPHGRYLILDKLLTIPFQACAVGYVLLITLSLVFTSGLHPRCLFLHLLVRVYDLVGFILAFRFQRYISSYGSYHIKQCAMISKQGDLNSLGEWLGPDQRPFESHFGCFVTPEPLSLSFFSFVVMKLSRRWQWGTPHSPSCDMTRVIRRKL